MYSFKKCFFFQFVGKKSALNHHLCLQVSVCLYVFIDQVQVSEMCGIPTLSETTQLVLHVWNKNNFLPKLDIFDLWETHAAFTSLYIPPDIHALCRYGTPFQGGTNAIIQYEAGIGNNKMEDNIVAYREVSNHFYYC